MIRRFVNIVAEDCRNGVCSLHRLDVSKLLFYPSTAQAQSNTGAGMMETLQELPAPCIRFQAAPIAVADGSKMALFGLVSPRTSAGRILCINDAGHSLLYDADEHMNVTMPCLEGFKGPVPVSLSIAQASAKEEGMYIMHGGVADGLELRSRFDVLRFGTTVRWSTAECWYWQSLPPPPFVGRPGLISSYTVLEGGRAVCLSSAAEGVGTYCFDTVRGEWWRAGDWVLPFAGRAEYVPALNLWLGFSLRSPHELCATSGLSATAMEKNQAPTLQHLWQDHTSGEWMATRANFLNLGSGRFAIAKVFNKVVRNDTAGESAGYFSDTDMVDEDEFLVLAGVQGRSQGRCCSTP